MDSRLKESVIKHLEYQKTISSDPDKPFMCSPKIGKNSWTIQEVIDEVRSETEFGEDFVSMIIGASIDRYCRSRVIRKYEQPDIPNNGPDPYVFPVIVYDGLVWEVIDNHYKTSFSGYMIIYREDECSAEIYKEEDFVGEKKYPVVLGYMTFKEITTFIKTKLT